MRRLLTALDRRLDPLPPAAILALAAIGVLAVGATDVSTGFEVSMSLFYLAPVALASWYAGRWPGFAIAVASCLSWYLADIGAGHEYSHPAIPVWNALVRFGFFGVTGLLLSTLRGFVRAQQHLARVDGLTGTFGRRAFEERLAHDLAVAQRRGSALSLAYVDVDDFKAINDAGGHTEGDRVLRIIGRVLGSSLRRADTAARIGGDEFALILPDTDGAGAERAVSKLTRALYQTLREANSSATCSIGVATFQGQPVSPEQALAVADELMYEVKHTRKGTVAFKVVGECQCPEPVARSHEAVARDMSDTA